MTRILLLGNSHAAALRPALRLLSEGQADLSCLFWGLPGATFAKVVQDRDGHLRLPAGNRFAQRKSLQWQVSPELDPRPFDHILLIGLRFHHRALVQQLSRLWAWEWGPMPAQAGEGLPLVAVSLRFLEAVIAQAIAATLSSQTARIPLDPRVVLMPAPYSGSITIQNGPLYEPATAALARHPQAALLRDMFESSLQTVCQAQGLRLCLQPRASLAAPWLSNDSFLALPEQDGRHLNDAYGQMALTALVQMLGLEAGSAMQALPLRQSHNSPTQITPQAWS